jgi:hypothetical protein
MHQHRLGAVYVEYLAAGTLPDRCAVSPVHSWRFKSLACIPQRVFSRGPVSLIAPSLKIGLGAFRQEYLRRCRTDIRPDRSRSTIPTDQLRANCRRLLGNRTGVAA